ncbi:DUF3307 domain-containing protein [Lacinutrix sp. C3R15]|uniref:DUF3307 domain-containing protein n=1 Tax=Flavobacteriaceae TaxID=49546 RepID=UPI001C08AF54|nr:MULTISPECIES: DUF3307 domain-containing protein [Flavobacteriaceae]MBU2938878.1 DUF3307 domain-containing protein [Lacinutrix sp. C3R15]MDO6622191.1 DUF3307 domain-containing protein [Oceanihabitans sp. 1_MG-2023]
MILLIKLLLAHLIGDFFLQPLKWVIDKETKKLKSTKLYLHVFIHVILLCILLWDFSLWPIIVVIGVTHLIIDATKLIIQKNKTRRLLFFLDQVLHIAVIFGTYYVFTNTQIDFKYLFTEQNILLITCLAFLTQPVSIIMKTIFIKWDISKLTKGTESLEDAGKYIGILERILVFIFIVANHWEAVGFLITAKSVFRFGDLKESKHRKLTEYILIGTLISFGIAIIIGLLYLLLTQ